MSRTRRVIPAILTDDPLALEKMVRLAESFTDYVQIDIMDGNFVPSRSVGWESIAAVRPKLKWEVHLMVLNPEKEMEKYQRTGAQRAIFHFESSPEPERVIRAAKEIGLEIGIAINPETPVSKILPLTDQLEGVLFMSVHPGFYGAKYLPEVLPKVVELRAARPELELAIDGGIKEANILEVARTGVDGICVGSSIFMQPDPGASFRKLKAMLKLA